MTHKLRHPLRILALGAATFCAASSVTSMAGSIAAVVGAVLGVVLGEIIGRRRMRLWMVTLIAIAFAALGVFLGSASTKYEMIPNAVGPATALKLSAILRFGMVVFAAVTAVRAAARRIPAFGFLELAAAAGAFAIPFAQHRDGVLVRPLWLSDWAWHKGVDPALILLIIGASVAGLLALIMMFESPRRPSATSFLALPAVAAVAAILFALSPSLHKQKTSEAGVTQQSRGEPPKPTQNGWAGQNGTGSQRQGSGGGSQQGSGNGGQRQGSGSGGGKSQQPQETDWEDPSTSQQKASPMAVVLLGDDWTPPTQIYYFRQEAWSQFAGNRLVAPRERFLDPDVPRGELSGTMIPPSPADAPGNLLLHADVALLVTHRRLFYLGAPTMWESLTNPDPQRFVRVYRFESVVPDLADLKALLGHEVGALDWAPELLEYYLMMPADPRFQELSDEIVGKIPEPQRADPFVRAIAIKKYLDEHMTYSTKHRHANVTDPTADYLFGDKIGYCVHQAHAAVFLYRAAGLPARIGVGYAVDADNKRGSSIMIRSGDAHAWPEIYLRDLGWVPVDIAAKKNLDPPGTPPDDDLQIQLAELARGAPPDPFTGEVTPVPSSHIAATAALSVAIVIAVVLLVLYSIKLWRRLAWRFAGTPQLPRLGYRSALDILSDRGRSRELGETREKFAGRLENEAPVFRKITDMHLVAKMGPPPAEPQTKAEWKRLLGGLRGELRAGAPWWKRLLATLNPISFRASR